MQKLTAKMIGAIGEEAAKTKLINEGYELVEYGRETHKVRLPKVKEIPKIHNYWIGSATANLAEMQQNFDNSWIRGDLPPWADLSALEVSYLAQTCKRQSICGMRDNNPDQAPCANPDNLFSELNLSSSYPEVRNIKYGGEIGEMNACSVAFHCSRRFNALLSIDNEGSVIPRGGFMRDNALVQGYVDRVSSRHNEENTLPYSGDDIRKAGLNTPEAEKLKEENREALRARDRDKSFPDGHPGRYDFIGYKDDKHVAIEVKVNSSVVSYWQMLRFKLLNDLGHRTMLVRVFADKGELENYVSSGSIDNFRFEFDENPTFSVEELYDFEETLKHKIHNPDFPRGSRA